MGNLSEVSHDDPFWAPPDRLLAPPAPSWVAARHLEAIAGFRSRWDRLIRLEPDRIETLRADTLVQSTSASVRLEGAGVSDAEVAEILAGRGLCGFRAREEGEVRGLADLLRLFVEQPGDLPIDENHLRQYHAILLGHSSADARHRGEYKTVPVDVTALSPDGTQRVLLRTASPFDTRRLMPQLLREHREALGDPDWHPLALIADFLLWFLAIHPFQDGNGRLARALHTLLLLKAGYAEAAYCSLDRVMEERRPDYYEVLRRSQHATRTDPSAYGPWFEFTLDAMVAQQARVRNRLDQHGRDLQLGDVERAILRCFEGTDALTTSQLSRAIDIPVRTLRHNIAGLVRRGRLRREGQRRSTVYRLPEPPASGGIVLRDGAEDEAPRPAIEPSVAGEARPHDAHDQALELLAVGDAVGVDRLRREAIQDLRRSLDGWIAATAYSPSVPQVIRNHHRLDSWRPVLEPLLTAVGPSLSRYLAVATALVEHDSPRLDAVGEDLLELVETPQRDGSDWVVTAAPLVARAAVDTLMQRGVWVGRWSSVGLLLRRRLPIDGARLPWPGHPTCQHPRLCGGLPVIAAEAVLTVMTEDDVTHRLGIPPAELEATAADANVLCGLVTLTAMGAHEAPAVFWGSRRGPSLRLLRTLADGPDAVGRLCQAAGISPGAFRAGIDANLRALSQRVGGPWVAAARDGERAGLIDAIARSGRGEGRLARGEGQTRVPSGGASTRGEPDAGHVVAGA